MEAEDEDGETALTTAADVGALDNLCYLIRAGADLDHRTKEGWTAMHYATAAGRGLAVEVLLRSGAHPDLHDYIYRTMCPKRQLEDMGTSPLSLCRRWMERSAEPVRRGWRPKGLGLADKVWGLGYGVKG